MGALAPGESLAEHLRGGLDMFRQRLPSLREGPFDIRVRRAFVGASLSDPNLLRYLYRSEGGSRHFALFVRQGDELYSRGDYRGVRAAREEATKRRWRSLGVQPLLADYFIQSSQFVYEVARRHQKSRSYRSYDTRLKTWERKIQRRLPTDNSPMFEKVQNLMQESLATWATEVRDRLSAQDLLGAGEYLALHLWIREPNERMLLRIGSSVRVSRDGRALHRVPISRPTPWVAVEAWCAGTRVVQVLDQAESRWNYVWGIPITLSDESSLGRLPVGVITLASSAPRDVSALGRGARL